ncbi:hypothetical protein [Aestuariibius sp. HNIBRBA575]|uniref:hypothetical protein n=1 Tax=Aestuariibius sp. HNIBRBA575 TaxID=3233343 RepID=UPI0034A2E26D
MTVNHDPNAPSQIWIHRKTGGLYVIIDDNALIEADLTPAVAYRSLETGQLWVRPRAEFHDGRFANVNSGDLKG